MTTVLQYLVIAAVIGLVVFGLAVFVFGRGEQLAPLSPRTSPTELPEKKITADDVRKVRFAMALRGYRMSDVDWALERMAEELDRLRAQVAVLSGETPTPDDGGGDQAEPERDVGSDRESTPDRASPDHETSRPDDGEPEADAVLAGMARGRTGRHQHPAQDNITGAQS